MNPDCPYFGFKNNEPHDCFSKAARDVIDERTGWYHEEWRARKDLESHIAVLTAQVQELQTVLKAWQSQFGTTQLTHARERLRCAEDRVPALEAQVQALTKERDDLQNMQNIPGTFQCLVCQYVLHARVIDAKTGNIGVSNVPADKICPNDGLSMAPRSWKQEVLEIRPIFIEKCEKIQQLESSLAALWRKA
mgnify:CR=1 FL=1